MLFGSELFEEEPQEAPSPHLHCPLQDVSTVVAVQLRLPCHLHLKQDNSSDISTC